MLQLIVTCCNMYEMRIHTHPCVLIRIHEIRAVTDSVTLGNGYRYIVHLQYSVRVLVTRVVVTRVDVTQVDVCE